RVGRPPADDQRSSGSDAAGAGLYVQELSAFQGVRGDPGTDRPGVSVAPVVVVPAPPDQCAAEELPADRAHSLDRSAGVESGRRSAGPAGGDRSLCPRDGTAAGWAAGGPGMAGTPWQGPSPTGGRRTACAAG